MEWQTNPPNGQNPQGWYPNYNNYQGYNQGPQMNGAWPGQNFNYPNYYPGQWGYGTPAPNFQVPPPTVPASAASPKDINPPLPTSLPPLPPDPPPGEPPVEKPKEPPPLPSTPVEEKTAVTQSANVSNFPFNPQYSYPYMSYPPPNMNQTNSLDKPTQNPIKFNLNSNNKLKDVDPSALSKPKITQQTKTSLGKNTLGWVSQQQTVTKNQSTTNKAQNVTPEAEEDWPLSLRRYVERCFARCKTDIDKDQVEICLKGKLTQATSTHTIKTKDWDNEPLISVYSQCTPPKNKENKLNAFDFKGDVNRGFSIKRKSLSPSPRRKKRSSSEESPELDFIPITKKQRRGKGKKALKGRLGKQDSSNPFYSKQGAAFATEESFGSSAKLEKRAARFANAGADKKPWIGVNSNNKKKAQPGQKRKKMNLMESMSNAFVIDDGGIDLSAMHIIGTSTDLEKKYLRLTSAPDPSSVRTVGTLKKALQFAKTEWKRNGDYRSTCDRMKSIRQDLTVQAIRDQFTVQVYEAHCRVALENGDVEEFNQCQSQLKQLYQEVGGDNCLEFTAYRLLYYIFTKNTLDITSLMAGLSPKDKNNKCVSFALAVRAAWSLSNYHKLFDLYKNAPLMSAYLMDWFCERERKVAIKIIAKSFRPTVESQYVRSTLAFDSDEDWYKFASSVGITFTDASRKFVDTKGSNLSC